MNTLVILAVLYAAELPQTDPVALAVHTSVRSCVAALAETAKKNAEPLARDRAAGRAPVLVCLEVVQGERT
jgi:hypothetical protein